MGWSDAAKMITMPKELADAQRNLFSGEPEALLRIQSQRPNPIIFAGEVLRTRQTPSVTDLLAKRVRQINPMGLEAATELAYCLGQWDPTNALPTLKEQFKLWCGVTIGNGSATIESQGSALGSLTHFRAKGGDSSAFTDYAGWSRALDPRKSHVSLRGAFVRPLADSPEDAAVTDVTDWLFNDTQSPWHNILALTNEFNRSDVFSLFKTAVLVANPAFPEVHS